MARKPKPGRKVVYKVSPSEMRLSDVLGSIGGMARRRTRDSLGPASRVRRVSVEEYLKGKGQ